MAVTTKPTHAETISKLSEQIMLARQTFESLNAADKDVAAAWMLARIGFEVFDKLKGHKWNFPEGKGYNDQSKAVNRTISVLGLASLHVGDQNKKTREKCYRYIKDAAQQDENYYLKLAAKQELYDIARAKGDFNTTNALINEQLKNAMQATKLYGERPVSEKAGDLQYISTEFLTNYLSEITSKDKRKEIITTIFAMHEADPCPDRESLRITHELLLGVTVKDYLETAAELTVLKKAVGKAVPAIEGFVENMDKPVKENILKALVPLKL